LYIILVGGRKDRRIIRIEGSSNDGSAPPNFFEEHKMSGKLKDELERVNGSTLQVQSQCQSQSIAIEWNTAVEWG
jgi:hypothetical protein